MTVAKWIRLAMVIMLKSIVFVAECSLKRSKTEALKRLLTDDNVNIEDAVGTIMSIKSVSADLHPQ